MLPPISTRALSSLLLLSSLVSAASAVNLDCNNVQVDKKKFDLSKLGGPHSILVEDTQTHPSKSNTTWTIDICQALKKPKGVPKGDTCPSYTRGEFTQHAMWARGKDVDPCTDVPCANMRGYEQRLTIGQSAGLPKLGTR